MNDATIKSGRNVVDFVGYREVRQETARKARAVRALCRHCGAALGEGESDDDCSSAGLNAGMPSQPAPRRMFRAE